MMITATSRTAAHSAPLRISPSVEVTPDQFEMSTVSPAPSCRSKLGMVSRSSRSTDDTSRRLDDWAGVERRLDGRHQLDEVHYWLHRHGPRPRQVDVEHARQLARPRRHDEDAVRQE